MVAASTYWIITLIFVYKSNAAVIGLLDVVAVELWGCSVDIFIIYFIILLNYIYYKNYEINCMKLIKE